jgi:membrane protein DedA with SNARE-associated domain
LESFLLQVLQITNDFNLQLAVILFLFCFIGEAWVGIPYVLETIWLLSGYQAAKNPAFASDLVMIWLVSQSGRQVGSVVLYFSGVIGLTPIKKFYKRFIESRLPKKQIIPSPIKRLLTRPSFISVALGRLIGMRIPMAMLMSANRKFAQLALGVVTASILWDGAYILIGMLVGPVVENKQMMLVYSVSGLTILYLITLAVRFIRNKYQVKKDLNVKST